jgi:hypothetical protein
MFSCSESGRYADGALGDGAFDRRFCRSDARHSASPFWPTQVMARTSKDLHGVEVRVGEATLHGTIDGLFAYDGPAARGISPRSQDLTAGPVPHKAAD